MKQIIFGLFILFQSLFSIPIFSTNSEINPKLEIQIQEITTDVKKLEQQMQTLQTCIDTLPVNEKQSKKAQIQKAMLTTLNKIESGFKFAIDKSDKIFSIKFLSACLLFLGPTITIYCKLFGTKSLTNLLNRFILASSQGAGMLFSTFSKGFKTGADGVIKDVIEAKMDIEAEISRQRFGAGWRHPMHFMRTNVTYLPNLIINAIIAPFISLYLQKKYIPGN